MSGDPKIPSETRVESISQGHRCLTEPHQEKEERKPCYFYTRLGEETGRDTPAPEKRIMSQRGTLLCVPEFFVIKTVFLGLRENASHSRGSHSYALLRRAFRRGAWWAFRNRRRRRVREDGRPCRSVSRRISHRRMRISSSV